jgi:hypothetical protein
MLQLKHCLPVTSMAGNHRIFAEELQVPPP